MTAGTRFQQDTIVTISGGETSLIVRIESWKYWEIMGELRWKGADRNQAFDTSKWCMRAEAGSEKSIPIEKRPSILVKVKGKKVKN